MLGAEQERRHLSAGDTRIGAVSRRRGRTTAGDPFTAEFLDPWREASWRDVGEHGPRGWRGLVASAVHATQEKHGHLAAGHTRVRTVLGGRRGTATGDPGTGEGLDEREELMRGRDIRERSGAGLIDGERAAGDRDMARPGGAGVRRNRIGNDSVADPGGRGVGDGNEGVLADGLPDALR